MTRKEQSERKLACVEMAKEGKTFQEIADHFGLTRDSVRQTCAKYGIREKRKKRETNHSLVIDLLNSGLSINEVAEKSGYKTGTVACIGYKNGFSFKSKSTEDLHEEIKEYKRKGHSCRETAEHFGMSVHYIERICRGIGVPEGYVNQYVSDPNFDQIANVKRLLANANPDMEYVDGFTTVNGYINIRCLKCNTVFSRSMSSIRHGCKTICPVCSPALTKEKKKERKKEQRRRRRERIKPLIDARKQERHERALINQALREKQVIENREARRHDCPICGTSTTRPKFCSDACMKKAMYTTHEASRRAKMLEQLVDKDITLKRLYIRDNGRCWICGLQCDYQDKEYRGRTMIAGNMYPSIDHVVALADGGAHAWNNVKLAHRICNSLRYYAPSQM